VVTPILRVLLGHKSVAMILSASESAGNGMLTVLLVLCATVIMVMLLRRHQFRKTTGRDVAREQIARIRDQRELRQSMDDLLVQLEELSRRVGAQVDTKFAKLETVIRDADDRIARLEHVLGSLDGKQVTARTGSRQTRPAPSAPAVSKAVPSAPSARETGRDPDHESAPVAPAASQHSDPRFGRVCELVDAGASPIEAAEQLGLQLGEVELILNLRKMQ
jgi:hypothetical protein